jgi:gp6-like head-tail connector protein
MVMLVSVEQASAHLRRDTDADDLDLLGKIMGASAAILNYIGDGGGFTDSNGDVIADSNGIALDVPSDIQIACLLLIGEFYKNREAKQEGVVDASFGYGFLPQPVISLLMPYRSWSLG